MELPRKLKLKLKLKLKIIVACAAGALALIGCGGGGGGGAAAAVGGQAPVIAVNEWVSQGQVIGACCFYSSLVFTDNGIRIYSNSDSGGRAGDLDVYEGTLAAGVGAPKKALSISVPQDAYIRTSAIAKYAGRYYAMLYTGTGYPPAEGYSPSWADSDDGLNFTWRGPVSPYPRGFSSGQALTVDDRGVFRAWIDSVGGTLREMSSTDGLRWMDQGDIWPASLPAGQAVFPAAARSPRGTMLSVADAFPSKKIRVLWKCDGQKEWTVLEEDSVIHQSVKGTSLSWDGEKFHAYGNSLHWIRPEPSCPRQ